MDATAPGVVLLLSEARDVWLLGVLGDALRDADFVVLGPMSREEAPGKLEVIRVDALLIGVMAPYQAVDPGEYWHGWADYFRNLRVEINEVPPIVAISAPSVTTRELSTGIAARKSLTTPVVVGEVLEAIESVMRG